MLGIRWLIFSETGSVGRFPTRRLAERHAATLTGHARVEVLRQWHFPGDATGIREELVITYAYGIRQPLRSETR